MTIHYEYVCISEKNGATACFKLDKTDSQQRKCDVQLIPKELEVLGLVSGFQWKYNFMLLKCCFRKVNAIYG